MTCGNSSVGRARPCQGRGREFESRFPLQINSIGSCGCFSIKGALAKRLCSGLQIRLVRFDSGTRLHFISRARMVESVDTRDLKSLGVRAVWVQVPLRVPWETKNNQSNKQCRETTERWFFCACNLRLNSTQIRLPDLLIPQQLVAAAAQPNLPVNHYVPTVRQL